MARGIAAAALGLAMATVGAGAASPASAATGTAAHPAVLPGAFHALVINRNSGKCLSVANGSTANGAWIQQYHCDGTVAAEFLFLQNGEGFYEIQNQLSHKCADLDKFGTSNNPRLQQFDCNGSQTQQWNVQDQGDGSVKLRNRYADRCAEVPYGSQGDSVILDVLTCFSSIPGQAFYLFLN
jgi:hypothetical protein